MSRPGQFAITARRSVRPSLSARPQEVTVKTTAIAATLLLCLSVIAASASTITATKAVESAEHLIARVGGYSARHADDPGAFAPWADRGHTDSDPRVSIA
jgi:hypothetical protein